MDAPEIFYYELIIFIVVIYIERYQEIAGEKQYVWWVRFALGMDERVDWDQKTENDDVMYDICRGQEMVTGNNVWQRNVLAFRSSMTVEI